MNNYFVILLTFFAILLTTTKAYANSAATYIVYVTQSSEPYYAEDGQVKHRTPPRQEICTISPEGINIPSISSEDIISCDVYNSKSDCIASFISEQDFISYIYSIKGTFEIRIHIDGYVFHGYIHL